MERTLSTLCAYLRGELIGDGEIMIHGMSAPECAREGQLTFAEDLRRFEVASASAASAILIPVNIVDLKGRAGIRMADPKLGFAKLLELFYPEPIPSPGVHRSAVLGDGVTLAEGVTIGAHAVIEDGVSIGRGSVIGAGVSVGSGVSIGEACVLFPNVVVYRRTMIGDRVRIHAGSIIGGDGFGYVFHDGAYHKMPQTGNVVIESDVEIGCNTCIDRATMGSTVIGQGTKIDNLVQVAHNNRIGRHVILAGQVGLAGSVTVEDYARLGGKAGAIDHVAIGRGAQVGAAGLVTKSTGPGDALWGTPARPVRRMTQQLAALARLPALLKQWESLKTQLSHQAGRLDRLEQRQEPSHGVGRT